MFCSEISAKGKAWRLRPKPSVQAPTGIDPLAASVAAGRGIEDLDVYFSPRFNGVMPRPETLLDLSYAIDRLCQAVDAGEAIGVIGDYDVDGATSTTIILRTLAMVGHANVAWRIPHRITDGYGPNDRLVTELNRDHGVTLLVVLDSGTAALGPIAHAKASGMDVIVIDHHEPGEEVPNALLVNPKRKDEDGSLSHLCTAGLAFLFCVALVSRLKTSGHFERPGGPSLPDLKTLLGLVALGTVADVVPLVGLNRAFVALGLRRLDDIVGIRTLMGVIRSNDPKRGAEAPGSYDAYSCSHLMGPCINAAGRLEDMSLGVELLMTEDPARADDLARRLHAINKERQAIQVKAVEEAKEMVRATGQDTGPGAIVIASESWHPGVVGLVAARIREAFDKPTAVIGEGGKGSARSVDGFHFGAAIMEATTLGILSKGGGHAAAAGFTAPPGAVPALRAHLDKAMEGCVAPPVHLDLTVRPGEMHPMTVEAFARLEPFGMGNSRPRVALVGGMVNRVQVIKDAHVKAWVVGQHGQVTTVLAFNAVGTALGDALAGSVDRLVDVMGTLDVNEYRGVTTVYVKAEDVMLGPVAKQAAA